MTDNRIPLRSEIPEEFTWDLTGLFANDEEWEKACEELKSAPEELLKYKGRLGESAETLLAALQADVDIGLKMERLHSYASLSADRDTGNNFYQNMRGKAYGTAVAYYSASSFMTPEIIAIPDDTLAGFYAAQPALETFRVNIDRIRRGAKHTLSPAEEKLLSAASEALDSASTIASTFRDADITFPDAADAEGGMHPLSGGSFVPLEESTDRVLRRNAYEAFYSTYGKFKNTVAATLNGQFKNLKFNAEARHYSSTLEAALFPCEVPVEVYTNLIEAVGQNLDKMHRYVSLRKKMLGLDELHMYDIYTPVVADAAKKISFEEAKLTVLDALAVMGEDYTDILKEGFANRWIDVYENVGKRGGAYSSGVSRPHPYVLLNHKDTLDCMFTLAHEMGHALHSYHSCKYQPANTSDYVLFVAEVASTCNEVLLMRYLLNRTTDKKERAYLINHFLDSFKGTVYRQTMFAEFELFMGQTIEKGDTLTADVLSAKYKELNEKYYGPDMVTDDYIALEWERIPHFYYDYYVYQYATGFSAACALADKILTEGESAVADYKKFLSGGCSTDPISLLKIAGVDMSTPEPVNAALKLFGELIDEMEALI